jgi:predicted DNA-binding transcriptional regulator AlpA
MAETDTERQTGGDKLYTLSDISQKTGISMPTLQRYKKLYQGRIPSVGSGRKQRYPDSALPVFDEIRHENIGRRGRPRKNASAAAPRRSGRPVGRPPGRGRKAVERRVGRPPRAAAKNAAAPKRRGRPPGRPPGRAKQGSGNLLTLTEISKTTGISYPTLVRYVRLHSDRLPHEGKGRARRFYPQAVDAFRALRQESGRGGRKPGRPPGRRGPGRPRKAAAEGESGALAQRVKALEKSQQEIERRFRGIAQTLQKLFR